jgi:hypothetical protein
MREVGMKTELDQVDHLPPGRLLGVVLQEIHLNQQNGLSAKLFFESLELGLRHPPTRSAYPPPSFGSGWVGYMLAGEGVGGGGATIPTRGQTLLYSGYIFT